MDAGKTQKRVSDEAVKAKTGKTWAEWFDALDQAGAQKLTHQEIVALVRKEPKASAWWQQMVSVGYEQARGLRLVHEKSEGFEISVSKTFNIPVGTTYLLFHDPSMRRRWLKDTNCSLRKSTENKSVRFDWDGGKTLVVVAFYPKSANKTQITVQHSKLPSANAAKKQKVYWSEQLEKLGQVLGR
ncbi:MAG: SRPBCC domain-containing protein [Terriglobales bacterium]